MIILKINNSANKAVIYCHGYNGCLVEAVKYAKILGE
jgi:hypothetical protein